ncbi:MAG: ATP-binding cassette domain-containing protein, partial [Burkholderiales bacterium]|nr:ATP-binding cassette domain-containing protein [Burkholderiales bacterium]
MQPPQIDNQARLQALLAPQENVQEALVVDLSHDLRFSPSSLVLTDTRLLALDGTTSAPDAQSWPLRPDLQLRMSDHAGVGTLELHDGQQRLALWRFTLQHQAQALRLQLRFAALCAALGTDQWHAVRTPTPTPCCPDCGQTLPPDSDECPACARQPQEKSSTWVLLRVGRFAKPYKGQLLLGLMLTLLGTAATLVPPYLTMPILDDILIPYQNNRQAIDPQLVALYLGGLLASAIVAWGLGWARTWVMAKVSERIGADMRTTVYAHMLNQSLEYFGSKRTGDLMSRIGSDTDRINMFLSLHALDFITDVVMMVMTAAILISINPWLALVTLVPLPFIVWLIHKVRSRLAIGFDRTSRVWAEITNVLSDTIPGVRVVKAFAQEQREMQRFARANQRNLQANDRVNKIWALFSPTVGLMTEIGLLFVWAFGIWLVAHDQITVGVLSAFIAYIGRFYTRLDSMSRIVNITQKSAAGAKRIFDVLDQVSSVPEPTTPATLPQPVQGAITLQDVGFRYGSRQVIRQLNLHIRPGEMIGLVGHSGSGKSTLVNLINRFYDVTEGSIQLDGIDVRRLAVADYRRNIGLVLQEPFLFFGTVAENIAYGKPEATRQEIVAAARAAHAHDFILRL